MDFILQRAKAFVAAVAVGVVPVIMTAIEKSSGLDIPASWEAWVFATVTGLVVYQTPNKSA